MSETNEPLDNTTAIRALIEGGDLDSVKTILGDSSRIKHSGVIRPGIKVPLGSCTDKEKATYAKMYADGHSFDEIDKALGGNLPIEGAQGKFTKSKLRPSNCDYFTVRREDFKNPADADMINERYADKDGRVRRIKIWFPISDLHLILPHGYRGFVGDGSVKCYSEFDEKGKLICHYIPTDEALAAKKDRRRPKFMERQCDHTTCAAYEKKQCDFGGLMRVNIPGMRGMGEVIIPTTSIYGLRDAISNMKRVREIFNRFSGLFNGEPYFELVKQEEMVAAPDGSRQRQYVPTVEPCVDLMELAKYADRTLVAVRGPAAMALFNGGATAQKLQAEEVHSKAPDIDPIAEGIIPDPATVATPTKEREPETTSPAISDRRKACLEYLDKLAKSMNLTGKHMHEFVTVQNFGQTIDGLTDEEIANFCNGLKSTLKTKDPAEVKADILSVVGG